MSAAAQFVFTPASREHAHARIGIVGPAGSGKTLTSLFIAQGLGSKRIALIDSERKSSLKHAGKGVPFDMLSLETFSPDTYVQAIFAAARGGFDCLIIDGLSQAWSGKDGALEMVDQIAKRKQTSNKFASWGEVTPAHNRMIDAMLAFPGHLIVTMRSKMEYVVEDVDGKKVPRKVGMAPIQRDGMEYEFDVVGDITLDHEWLISKSRCELFDRAIVSKPGLEFGATFAAWLNEGAAPIERPAVTTPAQRPQEPSQRRAPERRPAAANGGGQAQQGEQAPHPADGAQPRTNAQAANTQATAKAEQTTAPATAAPATAPAAQQEPPRPPCFSSRGEWSGAELWAGKPLESAPSVVVNQYAKVIDDAIANPKNKPRLRALLEHRVNVQASWHAARKREAAEALALDPLADVDGEAGWNLNGQGTSDDEDPQRRVSH